MLAALPLLVAVVAASRLTARGAEKHSLSVANNLSESTSSWSGLGQTTSEATAISVGLQKRQGVESCKESSPVCKCETEYILRLPFFHRPRDNLQSSDKWTPPLDGLELTFGAPTRVTLLVNGKGFKMLLEKGIVKLRTDKGFNHRSGSCDIDRSNGNADVREWWPTLVSVEGKRFSDSPDRAAASSTIWEEIAEANKDDVPAMAWKQLDYLECDWPGYGIALLKRSTEVCPSRVDADDRHFIRCLPIDMNGIDRSSLGISHPPGKAQVSCEWGPTHSSSAHVATCTPGQDQLCDFSAACSPAIENECTLFCWGKTKSFLSYFSQFGPRQRQRYNRCTYDTTASKCLDRIGAKPEMRQFASDGVIAFIASRRRRRKSDSWA